MNNDANNSEQINTSGETVNQEENTSEKLFTKEEVNKIVSDRLKRDRERRKNDSQDSQQREAELLARSNRLDCREYVLENNLPADLLEIIDTSDVEAFKQKATALHDHYMNQITYPAVKDSGEILQRGDPDGLIRKAFSKDASHTPKQPSFWK